MAKFCQKCGSALEDDATFCGTCGNQIANSNTIVNVQTAAGVAWSIGSDKKLTSKVTYGILAILLGGLGIHKFYAGKTMIGIMYLVTSLILVPLTVFVSFGILFPICFIIPTIALVEGICALATRDDGQGNVYV